jgi:hypothetical protein
VDKTDMLAYDDSDILRVLACEVKSPDGGSPDKEGLKWRDGL